MSRELSFKRTQRAPPTSTVIIVISDEEQRESLLDLIGTFWGFVATHLS